MANPLEKMVMDHLKAQASKKGKPAEGVSIAVSTGDDDEGEEDAGLKAACSDLLTAIKASDEDKLCEALKSFVEMCSAKPEEPESDDETSEV